MHAGSDIPCRPENLSDLVRRLVALEPFRDLYRGGCLLHPDSSRSLFVDDRGGFFHCFACGKHGHRHEWLIMTEGPIGD